MNLPPPDPSSPARTDLPPPPTGNQGEAEAAPVEEPVTEVVDVTDDVPVVIEPSFVPAFAGGINPLLSSTRLMSSSVSSSSSAPSTPSEATGGEPPKPRRGAAKRWALPIWGWLLLAVVVAGGAVAAVATRPDDDTQQVAELQAQVQAMDAELVQARDEAQQDAFNDIQEVRDKAEQELSDEANLREQAETAAALANTKYAELVAFEVARVQADAGATACSAADAAGYAQAPKPDATAFGPEAAAGLPADALNQVIGSLDQAAIQAKVDECYQTGSDRYLSQTTTTTTTTTLALVIDPPPSDPNATPS